MLKLAVTIATPLLLHAFLDSIIMIIIMAVVLFFNARLLWICVFVFLWCLRILETWCTTVICIGDMKQWHPLLIKSFFIILMSSTQKRITSEKKLTISFCNQRSPLHFVLSIIMTLQLLRLENNYKAYEFTRIVTKLERYMQQQRGKLLWNRYLLFLFPFESKYLVRM